MSSGLVTRDVPCTKSLARARICPKSRPQEGVYGQSLLTPTPGPPAHG